MTPATSVPISEITSTAINIANNWKVTDIFSKGGFDLINFIFILIGLAFFANLVIAGWDFMLSSGDSKKVTAASTRIVNGFIGLIMVFAAYLVVRLITNILGFGTLV